MSDPYAPLKDGAWREIAELDAQLAAGAIDEQGWHDAMARLIGAAYLAAETPWEQSGKSGTLEDWRYSRELVVDAFDRDGSFLDVGCASGFLMESVVEWSAYAIEPYGLDVVPELVELARRRLPQWADRIAAGNALTWEPARSFTYVRTNLEYVPASRRRELVARLLGWCQRLLVGVYNEERHARPTEERLGTWGFAVAGRTERPHRTHDDIDYRLLWIDA
jgi:SAM-dependent methyltransferase